MSLVATKLLSLLVYPLSSSLLLALVGLYLLWLRWHRSALYVLLVAVTWLYLCSTAVFAEFLMGKLEQGYTPRAMSVTQSADAIVLLGGGTRGYAHLGTLADLNQHADRLVHAVALYRANKAPVILVSGGAPQGGEHEAGQMRDILRVMGVPAQAMLLESQSLNTYENALLSARLLRERRLDRVLLVTSAFHMRRAEALFRAQGLEVIPAPTDFQRLVVPGVLPRWLPGAGNLVRTSKALHEMAGFQMYRWQGRFDAVPAPVPDNPARSSPGTG
tara:strand:+ start:41665 stop:42486 length:822 start_codon:yes stop_codon:yes gene_type:complete